MITVGIDCGSKNTKAVLLKDGKIISTCRIPTAFDLNQAAKETYDTVVNEAGCGEPDSVAITGFGRDHVNFVENKINEVNAAAKGAFLVRPETKMVIDLGAESSRAIKLAEDGNVAKFEVNDKCASGAGTYIEAMARALELDISQMGEYALRHTKELTINSQCVVFAESEVISMIHRKEAIEDIANGIHAGVTYKVGALARRTGAIDNIMLIGGTGYNAGLVASLEKELGTDIFVPEKPDFVSAIGAADYAASFVSSLV